MTFTCDRQEVHDTTPRLTGLSVHATSTHVHRKLHAYLHAHEVEFQLDARAFHVPIDALAALTAVLDAFTINEQGELKAAPRCEDITDHWQVAPLGTWLHRLATPWFASVSRNLHFHLQPIVHLATGRLFGYEALVRGRLDDTELGAPALLTAAAAHGQARAFDAHARRQAIRSAFPLLQRDEMLFINFAPGVVYNPDICLQTTFEACRDVRADFTRLLFEVTESEAFPDLTLLQEILARYRAEGAKVALDDLGAGHTSLTYLATLRPDVVKLDRELIRGLHDLDPRVHLVEAIVRFSHDLGVQVVIEGVETARELALARDLGADFAQGYFVGRPAQRPAGISSEASEFWAGATP